MRALETARRLHQPIRGVRLARFESTRALRVQRVGATMCGSASAVRPRSISAIPRFRCASDPSDQPHRLRCSPSRLPTCPAGSPARQGCCEARRRWDSAIDVEVSPCRIEVAGCCRMNPRCSAPRHSAVDAIDSSASLRRQPNARGSWSFSTLRLCTIPPLIPLDRRDTASLSVLRACVQDSHASGAITMRLKTPRGRGESA